MRKQKNKRLRKRHANATNTFDALFRFKDEGEEGEEIIYVPCKQKELDEEDELVKDFIENASIYEDSLCDPDENLSDLVEEGDFHFSPESLDNQLRMERADKNFMWSDLGDHPEKARGIKARIRKLEQKEKQAKAPESKKEKKSLRDSSVNMKDINRTVKAFIKDEDLESIPLQPMSKEYRKVVHRLCKYYNIKTKSRGSGNSRFPVLYKTGQTRLPNDFRDIDKILNASAFVEKSSKSPIKTGSPRSQIKSPSSSKPYREEAIIAEKANPIAESNIGNQLLRKLGWSPGKGLGTNQEGIVNPIDAVFKSSKKGLGN